MKWSGRRQSGNMEDRRGMSGGKLAAGGGVIGVIILLISMFTGGDSSGILNGIQEQLQTGTPTEQRDLTAEEKQMGEFVATVLADTEDVWHRLFRENGMTYEEPKLVLFTDAVQSACGGASDLWGRFTARWTARYTWIFPFLTNLNHVMGHRAVTLPSPMLLPTR